MLFAVGVHKTMSSTHQKEGLGGLRAKGLRVLVHPNAL